MNKLVVEGINTTLCVDVQAHHTLPNLHQTYVGEIVENAYFPRAKSSDERTDFPTNRFGQFRIHKR